MDNLFGHTPKVFKKILYFSIAAHIIALGSLGFFMDSSKKLFFTPVYTVSLVEPVRSHRKTRAKKVVRRTVKKKKAVKKHITKKKAVIVKKKAVKKTKTHEKELSTAISKIREKVKESEEQQLIAKKIAAIKEREAAEERARRLAKIRGSIKAAPAEKAPPPAASSGGLRSDSLEIKFKAYFSLIRDHVQNNWIVPERFDNEKVSVIVSIRIRKDGTLIKSWVEKGSGSRQFDDSLLKAVQKASPFPPLPQDFTEDVLETGLRFCPRCD
ncbi:MAG: cell envelope integrity protein TolA [Thermodesulfobacteriota bacterium]